MYPSNHRIIKCVGFESIHYAINLDIVSSSRVFSEFDFVFLMNVDDAFSTKTGPKLGEIAGSVH